MSVRRDSVTYCNASRGLVASTLSLVSQHRLFLYSPAPRVFTQRYANPDLLSSVKFNPFGKHVVPTGVSVEQTPTGPLPVLLMCLALFNVFSLSVRLSFSECVIHYLTAGQALQDRQGAVCGGDVFPVNTAEAAQCMLGLVSSARSARPLPATYQIQRLGSEKEVGRENIVKRL